MLTISLYCKGLQLTYLCCTKDNLYNGSRKGWHFIKPKNNLLAFNKKCRDLQEHLGRSSSPINSSSSGTTWMLLITSEKDMKDYFYYY